MLISATFKKSAHLDMNTGEVVVNMAFPAGMDKGDVQNFLDNYTEKLLDINFDIHAEARSLEANKMLWACLGDIRKARPDNISVWELYLEALENYGVYEYLHIEESAYERLKELYREVKVIGRININNNDMLQVLAFIGSSKYNRREFTRLLNGVVADMRELGLVPPPTEEMQAILARIEE